MIKSESPTVFVHYSWDNEKHKDWVLLLANRLVQDGVDVIFDRYDLKLGSNNNYFMEKIGDASKVLLIMTPEYKVKADNRNSGVGYEYQIITTEFSKHLASNDKFIPILRNGSKEISIPVFMQSYLFLDMRNDSSIDNQYIELLKNIYDVKINEKPSKGKRPDFLAEEQNVDIKKDDFIPSFGMTMEECHAKFGNPDQSSNLIEWYWSYGVQVYYNKHSLLIDGIVARRQPSGITYDGEIKNVKLGESFAEAKAKIGNPINWGLPSQHTSYAIYKIEDDFLTLAIWRNEPSDTFPDFKLGSIYAIGYCQPGSIQASEAIITISIEEIRLGKKLSYLEEGGGVVDLDLTSDFFHENYQIIPPQAGIAGGYFVKVIFLESKKTIVFWLYDLGWYNLVIRGLFKNSETDSDN